jgi:hypothetical protein
MAAVHCDVGFWGYSGRRAAQAETSGFDPEQTSEPKGQQFSPVLNVIQLARILAVMW